MIQPDEMGQYLEPAHRLLFGYGMVPWEFRYGMRSWLLPMLLVAPMKLGDLVSGTPDGYLFTVRMALAASGLATVVAARQLGGRISPAHGWVAFAVTAFWWQIIWFAPHPLSEPIATAVALAGYAAASRFPGQRTAFIAGMTLTLAAIIRFQSGPAIAVLVSALFLTHPPRQKRLLLAGVVAALAVAAAVDLAMGMVPLMWIVTNVVQNVGAGRADGFGIYPATAYLGDFFYYWGAAAAPIIALALIGARRLPAIAVAALVHLVIHSLIGHKEFRFILPTVTIMIILAAIGSVDVLWMVRQRLHLVRGRRGAVVSLVGAWAALCAFQVAHDPDSNRWQWSREAFVEARRLGDDVNACGILLDHSQNWHYTRSVMHSRAPIYAYINDLRSRDELPGIDLIARGANRIVRVERPGASPVPAGFTLTSCRQRTNDAVTESLNARVGLVCTYGRPGKCDQRALKPWLQSTVMVRRDE